MADLINDAHGHHKFSATSETGTVSSVASAAPAVTRDLPYHPSLYVKCYIKQLMLLPVFHDELQTPAMISRMVDPHSAWR